MSLLDARAAAVAEGLAVQQVDLMPMLEASLANYYDGFHPTPAGARIVAHAVAAAVLGESGLCIEGAAAAVETAFAAGKDGDPSPGEQAAPLLRAERA
jgi:phospholipase/lecithinase/hemolysin